jgi:hypothetical protein
MEQRDYKAVLEDAKRDLLSEQEFLGRCMKQQEIHERNIAGLRATIAALARLLQEEFIEEDAMGFTDAIRAVFEGVGTNGTLTPLEVKSRMEMMGYDITKYGNVMASVHTVINRLAAKGEIRQIGTRDGNKPCYQTTGRFFLEDAPIQYPGTVVRIPEKKK